MACTTILVGKNASYDGSTMIARNDDSGSGHFTAKKFVVVQPEEHPAVYKSVISHVEIPLPGDAHADDRHAQRCGGQGHLGRGRCQRRQCRHDRYRDDHLQPPRAGALVTSPPGRQRSRGGIGEEDIVYLVLPISTRPRGRAASGQACWRVRHL